MHEYTMNRGDLRALAEAMDADGQVTVLVPTEVNSQFVDYLSAMVGRARLQREDGACCDVPACTSLVVGCIAGEVYYCAAHEYEAEAIYAQHEEDTVNVSPGEDRRYGYQAPGGVE